MLRVSGLGLRFLASGIDQDLVSSVQAAASSFNVSRI